MTSEDTSLPRTPPKGGGGGTDSALKSFVSGGFGGLCCVLVGHPLDLVKVRMQAATSAAAAEASVMGTLRHTLASEGLKGIYRGVSAPIVAVSPMFAVSFWGFDTGKQLVGNYGNYFDSENSETTDHAAELTVSQLCAAGAFSAIPTTAIMAPSERIKCLLQMQQTSTSTSNTTTKATPPPKYNGMWHCAQELYKEGGILSIYKGTFATLLRDIPGAIAYFGVYEVLKREITRYQSSSSSSGDSTGTASSSSSQGGKPKPPLSPLAVVTAGGLAGMACWIVQIPADVLKSRFQTAPEGRYPGGLWQVYTELAQNEGHGALYRGIRPALLRAFPANAAAFMGMEVSKQFLSFLD